MLCNTYSLCNKQLLVKHMTVKFANDLYLILTHFSSGIKISSKYFNISINFSSESRPNVPLDNAV